MNNPLLAVAFGLALLMAPGTLAQECRSNTQNRMESFGSRAASWSSSGSLTLGTPEYSACGEVRINGGVSPSPFQILWDWGDGTETSSWFPASHRFESNGVYTVNVTAVGCENLMESTTVEITNAEDPGCPPLSPTTCYYVTPYNLHLTPGGTSDVPLQIRDHAGDPYAGDIVFHANPSDILSISADGYVTALRGETEDENGTGVAATVDGEWAASGSIVRVLPTDYGIDFLEAPGEFTSLYYPASIGGEDIAAIVNRHQIATVNDYAYRIQTELIGTRPYDGCRQIFEVDLGDSEQSRVCGLSGNPVRLGWNIEGDPSKNCFIARLAPEPMPHWFVIHHELGHNTTWASGIFGAGLGAFVYSESIASAMFIAAAKRILANPHRFPLGVDATDSLRFIYDQDTTRFYVALQDYVDRGAVFSELDPDVADGIWLRHAGPHVDRFASRFFLPLQPAKVRDLGAVLCQMDSVEKQHTFFAALVSAAAGEDLSDVFANTYHYPLDQTLFDVTYPAFSGVIDQAGGGAVPNGFSTPGQPLVVDKTTSGDVTLTWDDSCLAELPDYAIYEGTLGAFAGHEPRACSTSGLTSVTLTPSAGDTYYVVVPQNEAREGSYGLDSRSRERPQGVSACQPQALGVCNSDVGTFSGWVYSEGLRQGINDARVAIFGADGRFIANAWPYRLGYYESPPLPLGTYYARSFNGAGYFDEAYADLSCQNGCEPTAGTPIEVWAGTDTPGIDFPLSRPAGRITGLVLDAATASPLEGIRIELFSADTGYVGETFSNAEGIYSFEDLAAGGYFAKTWHMNSYYVNELYQEVTCPPFCDPSAGTQIEVVVGETTDGVDFTLETGGLISGSVTDADSGESLHGFWIEIYDAQGTFAGFADTNGSYTTITGLPEGSYTVWAKMLGLEHVSELYDDITCHGWSCDVRTGTPVDVSVGLTTTGIDLALEPAGLITGHVTASVTAEPIPNCRLDFYDAYGSWVTDGWTNSSGWYRPHWPLPGGSYYVRTQDCPGYLDELWEDVPCSHGCDPTTGTPITVSPPGETGGVDFALETAGTK